MASLTRVRPVDDGAREQDRDDRPPRVVLVGYGIHDQGGSARACAELIRHLHRDVRYVVVAAELAPDLRPLVERWVRVPIPRRPSAVRYAGFFMVAGLALWRVRADLTHVMGASVPNRTDIAAVHYCRAGARASGDRGEEAAGRPRRIIQRLARSLFVMAERWCYRPSRVRCLTPVSDGTAAEVELHYPGIPMAVVPNGVDMTRFAPDHGGRRAIRQRERAQHDLVALFLGGYWHRKGLDVAIEALAEARAQGVRVVLWVVGDGDRPKFETLARKHGVEAQVRFFGHRTDPEAYCRGADMFVLPSAWEANSLACLEAAASGLPLVLTAIPTAELLVGDNEGGIVVERTARSVAGAFVTLADDHVRQRMAETARRRVADCSWDVTAATTLRLYRDLLPTANRVQRP